MLDFKNEHNKGLNGSFEIDNKRLDASFVIENAIIIPIFFFALISCVLMGVGFHDALLAYDLELIMSMKIEGEKIENQEELDLCINSTYELLNQRSLSNKLTKAELKKKIIKGQMIKNNRQAEFIRMTKALKD